MKNFKKDLMKKFKNVKEFIKNLKTCLIKGPYIENLHKTFKKVPYEGSLYQEFIQNI